MSDAQVDHRSYKAYSSFEAEEQISEAERAGKSLRVGVHQTENSQWGGHPSDGSPTWPRQRKLALCNCHHCGMGPE
jgi:hypothetical protein